MAKRSRVPGIKAGRGGWTHFRQVADAKGWPLTEDERVVAALPVPGDAFSPDKPKLGFEVLERGGSWRVRYPRGEWAPTGVEVYDVDGNLKDMLLVHGGDAAARETHDVSAATFETCQEAVAYAKQLGANDVKVVQ